MSQITDDLIPKALKDQIVGEITAEEYEGLTDTAFHVTIQLADKTFRYKHDGSVFVTNAHMIVAREALWLINKELSRGGTWIWVWYAPVPDSRQPKDALLLWKDPDGDLKVSIDIQNPLSRLYAGERIDFESIAGRAHNGMLEYWRDLEVKPEQTVKAAQGQKPTATPFDSPIASPST